VCVRVRSCVRAVCALMFKLVLELLVCNVFWLKHSATRSNCSNSLGRGWRYQRRHSQRRAHAEGVCSALLAKEIPMRWTCAATDTLCARIQTISLARHCITFANEFARAMTSSETRSRSRFTDAASEIGDTVAGRRVCVVLGNTSNAGSPLQSARTVASSSRDSFFAKYANVLLSGQIQTAFQLWWCC
jgi:hypothetical protein